MKSKLSVILVILFWGSVWGIIEATLGWGFHKMHFHGGSLLLYTFGIFCMLTAAQQTGKGAGAVMMTAVVAAIFKLINAVWPYPGTLNPVGFILLEGLLFTILSIFLKVELKYNFSPVTLRWEQRLAVPTFVIAALLTILI
ncbi:MAG: hypothetical protein ACOYJK_07095 [Prevotella sp.]|jgi:hypothetical protein